MATISILPESQSTGEVIWRAVAGDKESVGKTRGEALDELMAKMDQASSTAPILVRQMGPDEFFTAEQQQRLEGLMSRWRAARDGGQQLPPEDQPEWEALVEA
jgi:sarcosine oxidase gamma subunit